MMWWFVILAASLGAVVWAAIAIYVRVRGGLKKTPESLDEPEEDSTRQ